MTHTFQRKSHLPELAGLWRRLAAYAVDLAILAAAGQVAGLLLLRPLADLGGWGRLLGFAVALVYFAMADSRICDGRSPGKRLLDIQVRDAVGGTLSPVRAGARFLILGSPYFLDGVPFSTGEANALLATLLNVAVSGVALSTAYLFVFNRGTRQSLHDIAVSSFVVPLTTPARFRFRMVWGGHIAVVAFLVLAAAAAPFALQGLVEVAPFAKLASALQAEPEVRSAGILFGNTSLVTTRPEGQATRWLEVQVVAKSRQVDEEALADRLARVVLDTDPESDRRDVIRIRISYGFDIGIASRYTAADFRYTPEEWRSRLGARSAQADTRPTSTQPGKRSRA